MSRGFELTSELLTTQGRALRALAGSLLRDAHAADDVVQETWLTCLRQPAVLPVRMSAWLGTVTRRLALRRARGEGRRAVRERLAAAPERLEDVAQRTLEREEALRAVTQALLALEEPFKSALLLRYYEDKPPQAIADELGLPLPTVKSRLARGLEKLRAKLGTEFRGDEASQRRGLLALAGLGAPQLVLAGGATAGGLLLGTKLWAAVAALVVAGGALTWWGVSTEARGKDVGDSLTLARGSAGSGGDIRESTDDPASTAAVDGAREDRREAARAAAAASGGAESFAPEASYRYRISGRVRDHQDLPQDSAAVYLAPRLFPFNRVATTGGDGRFVIEFDARRATLDATLGFAMSGFEPRLREVRLVAGQELVVDVGLPQARAEVRAAGDKLAIELGARAPEIVHGFEEVPNKDILEQARLVLETRLDLQGTLRSRLDCAPSWLLRPDGRGLFVEPLPMQACGRQAATQLEAMLWMSETERVALEMGYRLGLAGGVFGLAADESAETATVRGILRDAHGRPAPDVEVGFRFPEGGFLARGSSDASGAFVLTRVPARAVELVAGGGDHGVAFERVELGAGQELSWNPVLDRGAEVAGRLVSANGEKPLARARVELWSASSSFLWCDSTCTDEEGRFAIPNVPSGAFELYVTLADSPGPFPVRVLAPVFPGTELGDLALPAEEGAGRPFALRLRTTDDAPLPGAEVRVRAEATGFVTLANGPDEDGAFTLAHLPNGAYRVEAGGPSGWRDLGTIWIDARLEGVLDLGCERFPAPGYARLEGPAGGGSHALWSVHPDVFGHVEAHAIDGPRTLAMRPGEYVLCTRTQGERAETPFTVAAGQGVLLALDESSTRVAVRPTPLARESLAAQAVRCDACHAAPATPSVEVRGVLSGGGGLFGGF